MTGDDDLNDRLDDLMGGPIDSARPLATPKAPPEHYAPRDWTEGCPKCGGTGQFRGYSGRVLGQCFACKGKGSNTYKSSPEARAAGRTSYAARKERRENETAAIADEWRANNAARWEWLQRASASNARRGGTFDWPDKVIEGIAKYGEPTANMIATIDRLMMKDAERAEQRAAAAPRVDGRKIEHAFAVARERAARPGMLGIWTKPMVLRVNETDLSFQPGSIGSQWEHMIFVKAGERKLGHIADGRFVRKFACTDADQDAIVSACNDPLTAAKAYGKAYGRCMVCSRTLLADGSIEAGIGPICAEKYGW